MRFLPRPRSVVTIARLAPFYMAAGVLKAFVDLPTLARWAWREPRESRDAWREKHVVACVARLSRLTPFPDTNCLQRSLLLFRELSAGGADPRLVVGFRKNGARVQGHAWIEVRGKRLGEPPPGTAGFMDAVAFGRRGVRLNDASGAIDSPAHPATAPGPRAVHGSR
jgi:hypothetical protein